MRITLQDFLCQSAYKEKTEKPYPKKCQKLEMEILERLEDEEYNREAFCTCKPVGINQQNKCEPTQCTCMNKEHQGKEHKNIHCTCCLPGQKNCEKKKRNQEKSGKYFRGKKRRFYQSRTSRKEEPRVELHMEMLTPINEMGKDPENSGEYLRERECILDTPELEILAMDNTVPTQPATSTEDPPHRLVTMQMFQALASAVHGNYLLQNINLTNPYTPFAFSAEQCALISLRNTTDTEVCAEIITKQAVVNFKANGQERKLVGKAYLQFYFDADETNMPQIICDDSNTLNTDNSSSDVHMHANINIL